MHLADVSRRGVGDRVVTRRERREAVGELLDGRHAVEAPHQLEQGGLLLLQTRVRLTALRPAGGGGGNLGAQGGVGGAAATRTAGGGP